MPDISLLQQEYEFPEEERRAPGIVALIAFIFLLISLGSYLGFYFYNAILTKRAEELNKSIADLKLNEDYKNVDQMKSVGTEAKALKFLRENHSYPNKFIDKIAKSTHPKVYFSNGNIDVLKKTASLTGIAPNSIILARQIELYGQNDEIAGFEMKNIGYGEDRIMNFGVGLTFK